MSQHWPRHKNVRNSTRFFILRFPDPNCRSPNERRPSIPRRLEEQRSRELHTDEILAGSPPNWDSEQLKSCTPPTFRQPVEPDRASDRWILPKARGWRRLRIAFPPRLGKFGELFPGRETYKKLPEPQKTSRSLAEKTIEILVFPATCSLVTVKLLLSSIKL